MVWYAMYAMVINGEAIENPPTVIDYSAHLGGY